jgi:hypothetical protein
VCVCAPVRVKCHVISRFLISIYLFLYISAVCVSQVNHLLVRLHVYMCAWREYNRTRVRPSAQDHTGMPSCCVSFICLLPRLCSISLFRVSLPASSLVLNLSSQCFVYRSLPASSLVLNLSSHLFRFVCRVLIYLYIYIYIYIYLCACVFLPVRCVCMCCTTFVFLPTGKIGFSLRERASRRRCNRHEKRGTAPLLATCIWVPRERECVCECLTAC